MKIDYAREEGRVDQGGGGVDRETVKTTCTFFRSCSWLVCLVVVVVVVVAKGGNAAFADQYGLDFGEY